VASVLNAIRAPAPITFGINRVAGAAGFTAGQTVMQTAQILSAKVDMWDRLARGEITPEEAQKEMEAAYENVGFSVAMAPLLGALGSTAPNTVRGQLLANAGVSTVLQLGSDAVSGTEPGANDTLAITLNTLLGTGIYARNNASNSPQAAAHQVFMWDASIGALRAELGLPLDGPSLRELGLPADGSPGAASGGSPQARRVPPGPGAAGGIAFVAALIASLGAHDLFNKAGPNAAIPATGWEAAFPLRSLKQADAQSYNAATAAGIDALRNGALTGNELDLFLERIMLHVMAAASYLDFSGQQLLAAAEETKRFRNLPAQQRAQGGQKYLDNLKKILRTDPAALTPYDPRAPKGQILAAFVVAYNLLIVAASLNTRLAPPSNLAEALSWAGKNGFGFVNFLSGLANAIVLAQGLRGHNVAVSPALKPLNRAIALGSVGAPGAWGVGEVLKAVSEFVAEHPMDTFEHAKMAGLLLALSYLYYLLNKGVALQVKSSPKPDAATMARRFHMLALALAATVGAIAIQDWRRWAQQARSEIEASGNEDQRPLLAILDFAEAIFEEAQPGPVPAPGKAPSHLTFTPLPAEPSSPGTAQSEDRERDFRQGRAYVVKVRQGESFSKILQKIGRLHQLTAIAQYNGLADPYPLRAGRPLYIPLD
jgi:hypothetical protein